MTFIYKDNIGMDEERVLLTMVRHGEEVNTISAPIGTEAELQFYGIRNDGLTF